ncbi:MAG: CehA/McbA family metallohydrolase [Bacilli bacterium]|nr:CehA/McbA family metallohydrolase [Bacilli bacterium]
MKKRKFSLLIIITLLILLCTESIVLILTVNNKLIKTPNNNIIVQVEPGYVRGKVLTDNGAMVLAGIIIEDENGNTYRTVTNAQSGYNLKLAPGSYNLYFTRGIEYSIVKKSIEVESYKMYYLQDVRLVQLFDSYKEGWIGGDLHQHSFYSDGTNSVEHILLSNISVGLYYGFLSDHNSAVGLSEWIQGNNLVANIDGDDNKRMFSAYEAVEVTTEFGHYQSLGIGLTFDQYEVVLRESERVKPKDIKDAIIKEKITYIAEEIKRAGGVAQINHPYSVSTMGFNYWEVADYFDTIEIWNGVFVPGDGRYEKVDSITKSQNFRSKLKWFQLLNEIKNGGKFFPATGGSDNHNIMSPYTYMGETVVNNIADYEKLYKKSGKYSGQPTNYLHITGDITNEKVLNAIRNGNSFITNGPIIIADFAGISYGETVSIENINSLKIKSFCRDGAHQIKVIVNGELVKTIELTSMNYSDSIVLNNLSSGDWIVFEVLGPNINYAITNPIFIG